MTKPALTAVIHHLRSLAEKSSEVRLSDRQLLERYLTNRDEAAFTALVRRHGPLVLSACRRVLTDEADVEDAFQATFLVLLRKVSSVHWQSSLGSNRDLSCFRVRVDDGGSTGVVDGQDATGGWRFADG